MTKQERRAAKKLRREARDTFLYSKEEVIAQTHVRFNIAFITTIVLIITYFAV